MQLNKVADRQRDKIKRLHVGSETDSGRDGQTPRQKGR